MMTMRRTFARYAAMGMVALGLWAGAVATTGAQQSIFKVVLSPSPNQLGNTLNAVEATSARDAWAVGFQNENQLNGARTLTQHWNGAKWTTVPSPNPGSTPRCEGQNTGNILNGVTATSPSDVWAVGFSFDCSSDLKPTILHFDGSRWSVAASPKLLTTGNSALNGITAFAPNNIYAVGYQPASNGAVLALVEHFDGSAWSVVSTPETESNGVVLTAVTASSANDVWAVGDSTDEATESVQTLVEHFDGTRWTIVPSPNPLPKAFLNQNVLQSVTAVSPQDVTAAGFILDATLHRELTLIEHWDGKKWSVVPSPNGSTAAGVQNVLMAVSAFNSNDAYAVGFLNDASTSAQPETLVEHFDGSKWSIVPSPTPGVAQHLNGTFARRNSRQIWAVGASSDLPFDPETGLLQLPLTLVVLTPIG